MKRGTLISLDGLDGAGKTTQIVALADALRARGHAVRETREPTTGPFGRRIRDAARGGKRPTPAEELAWFFADRRQHVARVVRPALARGEVVLTDRYYPSTVAYQGARGIAWQRILALSEAEFPIPDLALVLEIAPGAGLGRVAARGGAHEPLFEEEEFLARVAAVFAAIERPYVARVAGHGPTAEVTEAIRRVVRERTGLL
ncbi:MAG TPA: dTMP kinase [Myxococcota bacterium]|nr:dTMP kinase [Myxococcota bacterium]